VTVKDQDSKELFSKNKIYALYDLHLPHNKDGYLGLDDWDITAMDSIDFGIEPGKVDSNTFVIPLNEDTKSVDIEAVFKYLYEKDHSAVIHRVTKKIEF
jgi:hypothetical protein